MNSDFDDNQKTRQATAGGGSAAPAQTPYLLDNKFNPGDIVGDNYQILKLIGSGGMGYVYSVHHRILQKDYAMKTLSSDQVSETAWRRLQVEAQAIAKMNHPNIVAIHNLGLHQGKVPYYVMDLLHGTSLAERLKARGPLELKTACQIFIEICNGLGLAHRKGIVHRDIKPGNIFVLDQIDASGARIKIVDFGIAKLTGAGELNKQNLTTAGEIFGSPYYMSPEQCEGKPIDTRSDIYSLGCTLFEALTGVPPFKGSNHLGTMLMHQTDEPPTLRQTDQSKTFPAAIENLVATMLAKNPDDRYQTLEQVAYDLQEIQHGREVASPYVTRVIRPDDFDDDDDDSEEQQANDRRAKGVKIAAGCAALIILFTIVVSAGGSNFYGLVKNNATEDGASPPVAEKIDAQNVKDAHTSLDLSAPSASDVGKVKGADYDKTTGRPTEEYVTRCMESAPKYGKLLNGGKTIQFDFPRDQSIGNISIRGDSHSMTAAQGTVTFPTHKSLNYYPNDYALAHPEIFASFRPDEIEGLSTPSRMEQLPQVALAMPFIARLTGLERIDLKMSKADDSDVVYLDKLPRLESLNLNMTAVSGKAISRLRRLKQLRVLYFSYNKEIHDLLTALAGSKALTNIYLESPEKPLSDADIKLIATCPNLMHIDMQASNISKNALKELKVLKKLEFVDVTGCGITEKEADELRFNHAKAIEVVTIDNSQDTFNKIGQPSADWIR